MCFPVNFEKVFRGPVFIDRLRWVLHKLNLSIEARQRLVKICNESLKVKRNKSTDKFLLWEESEILLGLNFFIGW